MEVIIHQRLSRLGKIERGSYILVDYHATKPKANNINNRLINSHGLLLYLDRFDGGTPVILEACACIGFSSKPRDTLRRLIELSKEERGLFAEPQPNDTVKWRLPTPRERAFLLTRVRFNMVIKRNLQKEQEKNETTIHRSGTS